MPGSGGSGSFEFTTNIEQIRQQIVSNLQLLADDTNRIMRQLGTTATPDILGNLQSQIATFADTGLQQIEQLAVKFRDALASAFNTGGTFSLGTVGGSSFLTQAQLQVQKTAQELTNFAGGAIAQNPELGGVITSQVKAALENLRSGITSFANDIGSFAKTAGVTGVKGTGLQNIDQLIVASAGNLASQADAAQASGGQKAPFDPEIYLGATEASRQNAEKAQQALDERRAKIEENLRGIAGVSQGFNTLDAEVARSANVLQSLHDAPDKAAQGAILEGLAKQEDKVKSVADKAAAFSEASDRLDRVQQQLLEGSAVANRAGTFALSPTEGLVRLTGSNAGSQITQVFEMQKALAGLGRELQNVQLQSERANRSLTQAFAEGFGGVGGSKYRGFGPNGPQFGGNPLASFAETAGIVAKYELQGVTIFRVGEALTQTVKNYAELSEAQEQLSAIMGEGTNISAAYTNSLQNLAVVAGESVVAALRAAQIGVAAFSTDAQSQAERLAVGSKFNTAAVQLGQITGQPLKQAAESEVAIGTSFGLGINDLPRIANAVAVAFEKFGADRTQTTDGLRQIAQAGTEAGFSLEQLAQVVGLVQARTAESGTTIAGSFGRIFSLVQGNQGQSLLSSLGIDTTKTVADQILQLGANWKTYSAAQQEAIVTTLGGERSLKELVPLLSQNKQLQDAITASYQDSGAAQRQQDAIINSVVGQLRILSQTLKNIGLDLARSGIFDIFGIALHALTPLLDLTDRFLQTWDRANPILKGALSILLEIGLAAKLIRTDFGLAAINSLVGVGRGALGAVGLIGRGAQVAGGAAEGAVLDLGEILGLSRTGRSAEAVEKVFAALGVATGNVTKSMEANAIATGEDTAAKRAGAVASGEGALVGDAAGAGRFAGVLGRLGGLTGAGALLGVTAAVVAVAGTADAWLHLSQTAKHADDYLGSLANLQGSADDVVGQLQSAAINLSNTAAKLKDQSGGVFGRFANFLSGDQYTNLADTLQRRAKEASTQAQLILSEQDTAATPASAANQFFNGSTSVAEALQTMSDRGFTTKQQVDALAAAVGLLGDKASRVALLTRNILTPGGVSPGFQGTAANANLLGAAASSGIQKAAADLAKNPQFNLSKALIAQAGASLQDSSPYDSVNQTAAARVTLARQLQDLKKRGIDGLAVASAVESQLTSLGKENSGKPLSAGDEKKITDAALQVIIPQLSKFPPQVRDALRKAAEQAITSEIQALTGGGEAGIASAGDLKNFLEGTAADTKKGKKATQGFEALLQAFKPEAFDQYGGEQEYTYLAQLASKAIADAKKAGLDQTDAPEFQRLIEDAQGVTDQALQAEIAHLEGIRTAFDSRSNNKAAIQAEDLKIITQEVRRVLAQSVNGAIDTKQLSAVLANATNEEYNSIRRTLVNEANNTRDLLKQALAAFAAIDEEITAIPRAVLADPEFRQIVLGPGSAFADAKGRVDKLKATLKNLQAGIAALGQAFSSTPSASDGSKGAKETQNQIDAAKAEALAIPGDPLSQAKAQLTAAKDSLKDIKNKNSTEYWNAYKALQDAKYALAEAERAQADSAENLHIDLTNPVAVAKAAVDAARRKLQEDSRRGADTTADQVTLRQKQSEYQKTAFDQKMSDEKTMFDLQQISSAQYLQFLENQQASLKRQLAAMKRGSQGYRQLLDELNSVDQAILQINNQLQGQFNLGDIKVPTPYEVRSWLKGSIPGGVGGASNTVVSTQITINGADTDKVMALLQKYLGPSATTRVTTGSRKT